MTTQVTVKDGKIVLCKTGSLLILDQQDARETALQILARLDADPKPTWTSVTCEDGATYTPWTDGWAVGFHVAAVGAEPEYIYFNPSSSSDDGKPCVFVYNGPDGDPAVDPPYSHFTFGPTGEGRPCDSFDPADYEESEESEIARTGDLACACGFPLASHAVPQ